MHERPVRLATARVLALGLAIHELATNAVKYGALLTQEGKLTISWYIDEGSGAAMMTFSPNGVQAILRAPTGTSISLPTSSET